MIHYITTDGIGAPWVASELDVMKRKEVPFRLHSLRPPAQSFFASAWAKELNQNTHLIYPLAPMGFAWSVATAPFRFRRRFFGALWNALTARRENFRARVAGIAHVFVAAHWARQLGREPVSLIHAQWIHSGGTVGMYAAWLLGVPFSFTGHAADLFRNRAALRDKIRRADFIVAISSFHRDFYIKEGAREEQLHIVHCGIEPGRFKMREPGPRTGRFRIVTLGRLVEKKGFAVLIDACKILAEGEADFECIIAGNGPLEGALQEQVRRLGLEGRVSVPGKPVLQEDLPAFLAGADIFAQPCVWAKDNDVDGTPRTLMEAMACGVACVGTNLVGIPDIITDGQSGLLVAPEDPQALAAALRRLMEDSELRERLGKNARARVLAEFEIEHCLEPLAQLFEEKLMAAGHGKKRGVSQNVVGANA
jgi:colanic acid/amylovoran biosynthesis glycosyltransferase